MGRLRDAALAFGLGRHDGFRLAAGFHGVDYTFLLTKRLVRRIRLSFWRRLLTDWTDQIEANWILCRSFCTLRVEVSIELTTPELLTKRLIRKLRPESLGVHLFMQDYECGLIGFFSFP